MIVNVRYDHAPNVIVSELCLASTVPYQSCVIIYGCSNFYLFDHAVELCSKLDLGIVPNREYIKLGNALLFCSSVTEDDHNLRGRTISAIFSECELSMKQGLDASSLYGLGREYIVSGPLAQR